MVQCLAAERLHARQSLRGVRRRSRAPSRAGQTAQPLSALLAANRSAPAGRRHGLEGHALAAGCRRHRGRPGEVSSPIDISSLPYQIPLGALLPRRVENLLPACKNLGVSHITNGCYRLHPVEWNIGEAAGTLAAFCVTRQRVPREVRKQSALLKSFQNLLGDQGVPLAWPKLEPR